MNIFVPEKPEVTIVKQQGKLVAVGNNISSKLAINVVEVNNDEEFEVAIKHIPYIDPVF